MTGKSAPMSQDEFAQLVTAGDVDTVIVAFADMQRRPTLCRGPVNTPVLHELFAKDPERAARRLGRVRVGRFAEPEERAAAVACRASDDASFITASTFPVDGGISGHYVTPL